MATLADLDWVHLNDLSWQSRRLLETRWKNQWAYNPQRASRIIQCLSAAWTVMPNWHPRAVLEMGAGSFHPLAHGLILYLNGAETALAVDVSDHLHNPEQAAQASFELLLHAIAFPERFALPGSNPEAIRQRAYSLPLDALQGGDWNALLSCKAAGFAYANLDAARSILPSGQIDFMFSNAVLEHIREPEEALDWYHRLLKPGGLAFHLIGLEDHRHDDNPEQFAAWAFMADGEYGPASTIRPDWWINGLRASQWRALFEKAGYEILSWQCTPTFPSPPDIRQRVRDEFRDLPEEDLRTFMLETVIRKPL